MSDASAKLGLYVRTVRHLRPEQIGHRIRLRTQQAALRRSPGLFERRWRVDRPIRGWPDDLLTIDAEVPPDCGTVDDLLEGRFTFLHEQRDLGRSPRWDPSGVSQLWLYHLHYWECAWTLAKHDDRNAARAAFGRQFESWQAGNPFGQWNAWAPYPTALRTWVFLNVRSELVAGAPVEADFDESLRLHAGFMARNLELDVGGNHLVKNLKALLAVAVFFGDEPLLQKAVDLLEQQVHHQVLDDGGHFELSPSYHCQVLGDFIDVQRLLQATSTPVPAVLDDAIDQMQAWLGAMRMPDGDVPLLNDAQQVGTDRIIALAPGHPPSGPLVVLGASGYVIARPSDRIHLVADVGQPCPPDLPAHAQADCLTFELAVDGERLVVDPGTSEYGGGSRRHWERSTAAHSTITVDDTDQTEVWGSFRAGRLATATLDSAEVDGEVVVVRAHHDGYEHLDGAPVHHREWRVTPTGVDIRDRIAGTGRHHLRSRLLLADPEVEARAGSVRTNACSIQVDAASAGAHPTVESAEHAVGHGDIRAASAITIEAVVELPAELRTRIWLNREGPEDR